MRTDFYERSCSGARIHGCRWTPEGPVKGVVQIVHGIAEYVERYDEFAEFLNRQGWLVVAEDHMGHGKSVGPKDTLGYFQGGWFAAVEDTYTLLGKVRREFSGHPYVLFGHSMGSFMARTILSRYPDSGISAAILCGTGWQPRAFLTAATAMCRVMCTEKTEKQPNPKLNKLIFGHYNDRIEHRRTEFDWLTREDSIVDAYAADPLCGFIPTTGLFRDLVKGMVWDEDPGKLNRMQKKLPVYFIAGAEDPVGNYGKGVEQTAAAFRKAGMEDVSLRLWPMCRHEILNEWNREEIYQDIFQWISNHVK